MRSIWLRYGIKKGWISPPYCQTHDGGWEYMSEETREEWDAGGDPCITAITLLDLR